jgi:predicted DNA-binding protein
MSAQPFNRGLWASPDLSHYVHFRPETESRLQELADKTGRPANNLVEDAMAGHLQELGGVREMLDGRYDDLKTGRVKPVDEENK